MVFDLLHSPRELIKGVGEVVEKTSEGRTKGTVSMGDVTSDDLEGGLKGKSLSYLYGLIVNGTVYVNIHPNDFPNGEIRGNGFVGIDRFFQILSISSGSNLFRTFLIIYRYGYHYEDLVRQRYRVHDIRLNTVRLFPDCKLVFVCSIYILKSILISLQSTVKLTSRKPDFSVLFDYVWCLAVTSAFKQQNKYWIYFFCHLIMSRF